MEILRRILRDADDDNNGGGEAPKNKTYNQDELNGIIGDRLAKEKAKIYAKFGVTSETELLDISSKIKTYEEENATLKTENENFKTSQAKAEKTNKLKEAGIDPDFIDVAASKWDGKQDLTKFVEDNPKLTSAYFTQKQDVFKGTGATLGNKGGGNAPDESQMTTAEFMEYQKTKSK